MPRLLEDSCAPQGRLMADLSVPPNVLLAVRVTSIERVARDIATVELSPEREIALPPFTAGGHIDIHLPNGLVRSYSLTNPQEETHRYRIAVRKMPSGAGGSAFLHDALRINDRLSISVPRNNFDLSEAAAHSVFIAGGIGVTPLWSMIQRLESLGRSWHLHYCVRSPEHALFLPELTELEQASPGRVWLHFDSTNTAESPDLAAMIRQAPDDAHLYCCGPAPMLDAFQQAAMSRSPGHIHVERFAPVAVQASVGGFVVELARSGQRIAVLPGQTILEALLAADVRLPHSCKQGVCGACEVNVLVGTPDHRDSVLSAAEQATGKTMLVCCSGSFSETLVLDI
jgi:vanillate O-demethylase ferredoxin subunit